MKKIIQLILVLTFAVVLSGCSLKNDLMKSNINPDTGDEYLNSDLVKYSCNGNYERVKDILKLGLDHQIDEAVECAVYSNDLETLQAVVEGGGDVHVKTEEGLNMVLYAVDLHRDNVVDYLLEQGIDPYEQGEEGKHILDYLLKPNEILTLGDTASTLKILKAFYKYEVQIDDMDIHLKNDEVISPLLYTLEQGEPILAEAFMALGATMDVSDKDAAYRELKYSSFMLEEKELIACILYAKGDISLYVNPNNMGQDMTAYYLPACAEALTNHYAQLEDEFLQSPLIDSELPQVVERLITEKTPKEEPQQSNEVEQNVTVDEEQKDLMYPMTDSQALEILQNAYPEYTLLGGGEISPEEYNDGTGMTEPAYLYSFRSPDLIDVYVGKVFASGEYKFRYGGDYIQN